MSSTNPDARITQLRLSSARHRIRAFLEQVKFLSASGFPHADGKEALRLIGEYFEDLLGKLDLPEDTRPDLVDRVCAHSSVVIARYTPILGFILRSTNVRNAFETYHPIKRIVCQLLGANARVLISSEWNFVPFTYPMTIDILPRFALLGGPATESNNVLVLPLAGHEIGHSVWREFGCSDHMQPLLYDGILAVFENATDVVDALVSDLKIGPLGKSHLMQTCLDFGIKQLEEIFCDAVGLRMFSTSFAFSFEYFMAPGGRFRDMSYPSDLDRIGYVLAAASKLGVSIEESLFGRWSESKLLEGTDKRMVRLIDQSVKAVADTCINKAIEIMDQSGVPAASADNIKRIEKSFERHEPEDESASLAEIVCAGWNLLRNAPEQLDPDETRAHRLAGELMLKSIEISEFRSRIERNAERD